MSTTVNYKGNTIATLSNETKTLTTAGTWVEGNIEIIDAKDNPTLQSKTATPTESTQTIAPDTGYDGLSSVEVGAISSSYVGSGVPRKSSTDVTKSETENGLLITVPIGYYSNDITELIPNANIEELYVSSYQDGMFDMSLLIDSAGYMSEFEGVWASISPGEVEGLTIIQNNTVITPTESEQTLVDGTFVRGNNVRIGAIPSNYIGSGVNQNDSDDLTVSGATVTAPAGYYAISASKSVASGTAGTPTATKGTVSNHSISVTPSVTNTTGYITGGTVTGTAVTITASELASGAINIDDDGTYDVTNYASAEVAIDYESKVRAITFIVNRNSDDTTTAKGIAVHQTFSSQINFSNGIKTIGSAITIPVGDATKTTTLYAPKSRPIIVIRAGTAVGNFDVIIDSSYGECVDVPYILGASSTGYTKAVYLKTNAPDEFTVTINLNSQATYPDTVLLNSLSVTSNGTYTATSGTAYSSVNVEVEPTLQSKTNINPTTSSQTITADSGYDGLSSVQINAMPSGTAGTPTATKGSVSNHSVSITPSVTNTTGYITGGTKTGTAVTVSASELVSDTLSITSSGTKDVTNYASASVAAGTEGTPIATKGTVSNHQVSVTPSVTNTAGYISGGTKTGTAVTVTASELANGNKAIASNGTNIDVVGYSTVSVDVPDSTLVVTVSYNSSTNRFEPDKTYSEISAANAAGKTIVVNCTMVPSIASADGVFDTNKFTYWVREYLDGSEQMLEQEYILNSNGLTKNQEVIYYENASSGSPSLQAKTNISPTTSSQTITADSGYDGLSSVQINAMPTMTLPSSASSTSSGTSKATISRSTSNQYINIPTGYNSTAQYYTISATPNMTLPTAASSTSSGTSKATITPGTTAQYLNIPTGYNGTAQYYTISAVTYSTIRTGTTTPASSLGSNGDVYIKTS